MKDHEIINKKLESSFQLVRNDIKTLKKEIDSKEDKDKEIIFENAELKHRLSLIENSHEALVKRLRTVQRKINALSTAKRRVTKRKR